MSMKQENIYHSPSKGRLDFAELIGEIKRYIKEQPERHYSIVVGTDSYPSNSVDYVTAVVVHRKGRGGRYFWRKKHQTGKTPTLRNRIYEETMCSIGTAQKLLKTLGQEALAKYDLEIHIDVGSSGPTREMITEVVGMVKGNGFTARTKPEAYAASTVADRYT
jgi:uncharacterized protein